MSNVSRRGFLKAAAGTVAGVVGAALVAPAARASQQLSDEDIIRAWKDEDFRRSLTDEQRAQLPEHPSGAIEIQKADLDQSPGARYPSRGRGCTRSRRWCRYR